MNWSAVSAVLAGTENTPGLVDVSGTMTAPLTPVAPRWMWAAVAVMPVSVMLPLATRVRGLMTRVPVPVAVEPLVGTSCAAFTLANFTFSPIWPRISPSGNTAEWALKSSPPAFRLVTCASVSVASATVTQMPLPTAVSVSGKMTRPLAPNPPVWMCAAVAVMPVNVTRPVIFLVAASKLSKPLPVAVEALFGTS